MDGCLLNKSKFFQLLQLHLLKPGLTIGTINSPASTCIMFILTYRVHLDLLGSGSQNTIDNLQ